MKRDIIYVARIGVSTVAKRLTEFSKTKPGKLNAEEFHKEAIKMEKMEQALLAHPSRVEANATSVRCHHLESGAPAFASGMCRNCYLQYLSISGGIFEGTADPPAFTKGGKKTLTVGGVLKLASALEADEADRRMLEREMQEAPDVEEVEAEMEQALSSQQLQPLLQSPDRRPGRIGVPPAARAPTFHTPVAAPPPVGHEEEIEEDLPFDEDDSEEAEKSGGAEVAVVEVDALEDVLEEDIADYLLPPAEIEQKTLWWQELHKEHLRKAASRRERPVEKEKKRRRSAKKARVNSQEYSSAFEAVKGMLEEKGLSSKINYDNLEALFAEGTEEMGTATPDPPGPQKRESFFLRSLSFRKGENSKGRKRLDGLFD